MEKATEIFEKHWTKATGKPLDEATKHHMKYAIEAINEALLLSAVSGRSELLKAFIEWQKWDYKKPYDTPTDEIIKDYESL